jgi:flagellar hook protein FlgE
MALNSTMETAVSGLEAQSQALNIDGNNIANANTVGFKASRAVFEDMLSNVLNAPGVMGSGVTMTRAQQVFTQGTLSNTGVPTDLALSGDGFFAVQGTVDGVQGTFYTRNGQDTLNQTGTLVDPNGLSLLGYQANANGTFGPAVGPVQVNTAALSPVATTTVNVTANLNANDTPPVAAWDPQNPSTTSNFSTSINVYDSLGDAHQASVYFVNNGAGQWTYHALANGSEVAGGVAGQNVEIATGTLAFTSTGALNTVTPTAGGTVSFNNATANQAIAFNFGTPISAGGKGLDGTTDFAATDSVASQSQDGYASGSLSGVQIDSNGVVNGVYTNGQTVPFAQLAVAKFVANDGLAPAGNNLWTATTQSGDAALGTAGSGGRASVTSGSLEQSNVDLAGEMVNLITNQRTFEANSKTISTADQMLEAVVNLIH